MRPAVVQAELPDVFQDIPHLEDDGLFVMDLDSGASQRAVSYATIRGFLKDWPDIRIQLLQPYGTQP